jgi:hypothetical protein
MKKKLYQTMRLISSHLKERRFKEYHPEPGDPDMGLETNDHGEFVFPENSHSSRSTSLDKVKTKAEFLGI